MKLYRVDATTALLVLGAIAVSGCSDDAYCYSCGQSFETPQAEAGADTKVDVPGLDSPINTEASAEAEAGKKCPGTMADCNFISLDGCETNLATDPKNCGKCSNACALAHATAACKDSVCVVKQCALASDGGPGVWHDCNADPADGCEVDTTSDSNHCGGCGKKCPAPPHATAECVDGICGEVSCDQGFADCNQDATDGCEADLQNDANHCGSCTVVCPSVAHGQGGCNQGACGVGVCETGYADCDNSLWSGCETELATDVNHCGTCAKKCGKPANGLPKCEGSQCLVDVCDPGYADCNGIPTDGCEVNLANDPANCAACDAACNPIAHGQPGCAMFVCGIASCDVGYRDCFGGKADGCETATGSDVDHCGDCNTVCQAVPNGVRTCDNGQCKIGSCDTGYSDCNKVLGDGCEATPETDVNNCGTCGNVCAAPPGATAGCSGGQCGIGVCAAGFADCNQNISDGCEFDITSDWQNCGGCGVVCGSHSCVNSACVCTQSVLVIPDDSAQGTATLTAALTSLLGAGWTVTTATKPSYQYDGVSPAPAGFGAVLLLAGGPSPSSYSTDMPAAGQTALSTFVQASNGIVLTEWAAKHVADSRWQTIKDLVLLNRVVAFSGQVSYKVDPGFSSHPVWDSLQGTFTFASTSNVGVTKVANGVTRIAGSAEAIDAVAIRDLPAEGRVVHIAHAGNYSPNGWSNTNIQRLVANSIRWAARCN